MSYCFICILNCQNTHNLGTHSAGKSHIKKMQTLWDILENKDFPVTWNKELTLTLPLKRTASQQECLS